MNKRATPGRTSAPSRNTRTRLTPTDRPGVFKNRAGVLVDEDGISLSFQSLRSLDNQALQEALDGAEVTDPAELLRRVACDPRLPLSVRLDAAHKAAPYFTPKKIAIQGGGDDTPPVSLRVEDLSKLSLKKLEELEAAQNKITMTLTAALEKVSD